MQTLHFKNEWIEQKLFFYLVKTFIYYYTGQIDSHSYHKGSDMWSRQSCKVLHQLHNFNWITFPGYSSWNIKAEAKCKSVLLLCVVPVLIGWLALVVQDCITPLLPTSLSSSSIHTPWNESKRESWILFMSLDIHSCLLQRRAPLFRSLLFLTLPSQVDSSVFESRGLVQRLGFGLSFLQRMDMKPVVIMGWSEHENMEPNQPVVASCTRGLVARSQQLTESLQQHSATVLPLFSAESFLLLQDAPSGTRWSEIFFFFRYGCIFIHLLIHT